MAEVVLSVDVKSLWMIVICVYMPSA